MDNFFEVILRVPPLIVLDHILATNFGTRKQSHYEFMKLQVDNFLFNKTPTNHAELNVTGELELNDNDATYLTINLNLLGRLLFTTKHSF